MNSNYLAQYLVNEGKLTPAEIKPLLADIAAKDPQLPLMALKLRMLDADALKGLDTASSGDFGKDALQKGLLSHDQLQKLHRQMPGETLRFAQALLDGGRMDFGELQSEFAAYEKASPDPVYSAVEKAAAGQIDDPELYADYMTLFMDSLVGFLHTPVVIDPEPFVIPNDYFSDNVYEVSQRIEGDANLVSGMMAKEKEFISLAARYSQEEMNEVDDLAVDSMEEFFNVVNGLYCIQLAGKNKETELGLPRWNKNIAPRGDQQLLLKIHADLGSFAVVLAADEFM